MGIDHKRKKARREYKAKDSYSLKTREKVNSFSELRERRRKMRISDIQERIKEKGNVYMENILSLKEGDPSQLFADWPELIQPCVMDYINMLDKLYGVLESLVSREVIKLTEDELELVELAEVMMQVLKDRDVAPREQIYVALLGVYSRLGDANAADRIARIMELAGIPPSLESCSYLVDAHVRAGDHVKARLAFDYITKIGLKPGDEATASMLKAYLENNLDREAVDLISKLEIDWLKTFDRTYSVLVGWSEEIKNILNP